jgi:hypothetical protein
VRATSWGFKSPFGQKDKKAAPDGAAFFMALRAMPYSLFETFSLEFGAGLGPQLKSHACKKSGHPPLITAHRSEKNLRVTYRAIAEIEVAFGREDFRGEPLAADTFGVTFRPDICVALRDGTTLLPQNPSDKALTRVTYHNLSKGDFLCLAFLRHKEDRLLFIQSFTQADLLLRIATENLDADALLSAAAYERAMRSLENEQRISAEAAYAFADHIAATNNRHDDFSGGQATSDFRRLDLSGEAALVLATQLSELKRGTDQIQSVLEEGLLRLMTRKPRQASSHLYAMLDFVTRHKLPSPQPAKLLWQTYLAASAERAVGLLRKVFLKAKAMKADQETLEMIYKTWRGFAESDRRSGIGALPKSNLTIQQTLDERGGDAG